MGPTIETGATDQRPEDLRRDGQCPECGHSVTAEDPDHNCTETADAETTADTDD